MSYTSYLPDAQEGGGVSRQNIGRVLTTSVTSRHRSVIFKMAGKFVVRYLSVPKTMEFPTVWMIHLLYSMLLRILKI